MNVIYFLRFLLKAVLPKSKKNNLKTRKLKKTETVKTIKFITANNNNVQVVVSKNKLSIIIVASAS